jgi:hypothetical protein
MNKAGFLAAAMIGAMGVMDAFPTSRGRAPEPKWQSEEEARAALEKAQAKRDRKAAKRLKSAGLDLPLWTPEMFVKLDKLVKELDE